MAPAERDSRSPRFVINHAEKKTKLIFVGQLRPPVTIPSSIVERDLAFSGDRFSRYICEFTFRRT
jgi:hypothetical protein